MARLRVGAISARVSSRSTFKAALHASVAFMVAGGVLASDVPGAWGQSLFWDGTDTTVNADGGDGTWDDGGVNTNWVDGVGVNVGWTDDSNAVFGGADGSVTITGTVAPDSITIDTANYNINSGTITSTGVTDGTVNIIANADATISSSLVGDFVAGVGAGTLNVSGTSVDLTTLLVVNGATVENTGTLGGNVTNRGNFTSTGTITNFENLTGGTATLSGAATNVTVTDGTTQLGGNLNITGALAGAGSLNVAANALTIDVALTAVFEGDLAGSGTIEKNGAGTWTLSGDNSSFSGTVNVNVGDITIDGTTASVNIQANSTDITLTDGTDNAGLIIINSPTTRLLSPGTATQSGVISELGGARPLEIAGGGTLTLAADNTYTGDTTISGDTTVQFSGGANIDSTVININSGTLNVDGGAERLANNATVNNADNFNVTGAETIGVLNNSADGTTTVSAGQTLTVSGAGATALNQTGGILNGGGAGATINLTAGDGGFTQSGATTATSGTLQINTVTFNQSGGATIATNTTVTASGAQTLEGGNIAGTLDGAGVATVQTGVTNLTGSITNAASVDINSGRLNATGTGSINTGGNAINVSGSGELVTDGGALDATENVFISGGEFASSGTEAFASLTQSAGSVGGGVLNVTGLYSQSGGTTANGVDINAGTFTKSGGTIAAGTAVTSTGAQSLQGGDIEGRLDGGGAVTVSGFTTNLTGAIDGAASVTVTGGTLDATGAGSIDTSGNMVAVDGGTLSTDGGALATDEAVTVGGGTLSTTGTEQVASIVLNSGTLGPGTFLAPVFGRTGGTLSATVTSDLEVIALGGAIPTLGLDGVVATNGTAAGIQATLANTGVMNVAGTTALDLDASGGGGPVTVTVDGQIIGTATTGVNARTAGAGNVLVDVNNNVTTTGNAIVASTTGTGTVQAVIDGLVTSTSGDGVTATSTTGLATVNVNNRVTADAAGASGVSVTTTTGNAIVTVNDIISATGGGGTGLAFNSASGTATVTVGGGGAILAPDQTAISATGGANANVTNNGGLAGGFTGGTGTATITNNGLWNASGVSDFGALADGDSVTNAMGGTINFDSGASFTNLETFDNDGIAAATGPVTLTGLSLFDNSGTFNAIGAATITGSGSRFINTGFMAIGPGSVVSNFSGVGGGNINAAGATLNLGAGSQFTAFGPFENAGTMNLLGDFTYQGAGFTNASTGRVNMTGNGSQIFDISGNLTGQAGSVIAMDTNLGPDKSANDLVRVSGTVSGPTFFQLNDPIPMDVIQPGTTTLLTAGSFAPDASFSFGGISTGGLFDVSLQQGLLGGVPSVYLLAQFDSAAASGLVSNFIAAQDAISTAFFKPSSGFVASPIDPEPNQIGFAPWFRFNTGLANATNGGVQSVRGSGLAPTAVRSEVNIDYVGYQFGFDGGMFNIGDTGASAHLGVIAGQIFGGADQSGFNSRTGVETNYIGGYAVYSRGPYFLDAQVRQEFTQYTLDVAEPDLMFSNTKVDSQRFSAGFSAGVVQTLGEFAFVPVIGYTYAKTETDDVPITAANTGGGSTGRIIFDDSPSHIGFVGLTVATNVLLNEDQLSLTPFVTLSAYNDFGGTRHNVLQLGGLTSDISIERSNIIGELSVGANILTLAPESFGENRVLTGNFRADLQFGENILGGALNAQVRLQF